MKMTLTNVNGKKYKLNNDGIIIAFYQVEYNSNEGCMPCELGDTILDDAVAYLTTKCRGTFPRIVVKD